MPIVPSGTNPFRLPTLSADNRPSIYQSPVVVSGAFGVDVRGLEKGVNRLAVRFEQMEDENDRARAFEAYRSFCDRRRAWDQETLDSVQGGNALGIHRRADETYRTFAKDLARALPSDRARGYFDELFQPMRASALEGWSRYEAVQRDRWMTQTTRATMNDTLEEVAANWKDETRCRTALKVSETALRSDLMRKGTGPELVEQAVSTYQSTVIQARIEGAMAENPLAAQQLLAQSAELLPRSVKQELEVRLLGPVERQRGRLAAQEVTSGLKRAEPQSQTMFELAARAGVSRNVSPVYLLAALHADGKLDPKTTDIGAELQSLAERTEQEQKSLKDALGREPEEFELFAVHQWGVSKAVALLGERPAPASEASASPTGMSAGGEEGPPAPSAVETTDAGAPSAQLESLKRQFRGARTSVIGTPRLELEEARAEAEAYARARGLNDAETVCCVEAVGQTVSEENARTVQRATEAEEKFRAQIEMDPKELWEAAIFAHPDLTSRKKAELVTAARRGKVG